MLDPSQYKDSDSAGVYVHTFENESNLHFQKFRMQKDKKKKIISILRAHQSWGRAIFSAVA